MTSARFRPRASHGALLARAADLLDRLAIEARPPEGPPPMLEVYRREDWERRNADLASLSGDSREVLRDVLSAMKKAGSVRPLARVPEVRRVLALKERHPHFEALIEAVVDGICLASRSSRPAFHFAPHLLWGPPGTGKTTFAKDLAATVDTGLIVLGMANRSSGFDLAGLSAGWSTARAGQIHNHLTTRADGKANPIVLLDELDKAIGLDSRGSPLGALYGLLETTTSRRFEDELVGIPIDASQVSWIATANQPELIEPALRTRLKIIEVRLPTPAQARLIAHHVYADLRRAAPWGTSFSGELPEAVAEALSEDSPRDQRLRLEGAFARAARAQRDLLQVADLPARRREAIATAEANHGRFYDQARVGFTVPLAARKSAAAA